jgi:hypothetical protein
VVHQVHQVQVEHQVQAVLQELAEVQVQVEHQENLVV